MNWPASPNRRKPWPSERIASERAAPSGRASAKAKNRVPPGPGFLLAGFLKKPLPDVYQLGAGSQVTSALCSWASLSMASSGKARWRKLTG